MKNPESLIAATLIFIACLLGGYWIAQQKGLWIDEYYTQVSSVHNTSYTDQLLGHIPEGNNTPLFYALQKLFLGTVHYQTPPQWVEGHWYNDSFSKIILRINPVIFMSLSMSLVFYYFCRGYSLWTGFYSLFIYCSSYMLWVYWAEARPYALLVFLTTVQSVILLNKMDQNPRTEGDKTWLFLAAANILLSLTSILSLGEIVAVSVLWWALKERDWRKYIALTLLPALIVGFYYVHAPKYPFYFGSLSPEQLIRDNISRERFDILFLFLIFLSAYSWGHQKQTAKFVPGGEILKSVPYVIFMVLVLASSAGVLWLFSLRATPGKGFPITSRYFIYLMPIGIIATTMLTISLVQSFSKKYLMQVVLVGLFGILLVQHFLKIVPTAIHSIMSG